MSLRHYVIVKLQCLHIVHGVAGERLAETQEVQSSTNVCMSTNICSVSWCRHTMEVFIVSDIQYKKRILVEFNNGGNQHGM